MIKKILNFSNDKKLEFKKEREKMKRNFEKKK